MMADRVSTLRAMTTSIFLNSSADRVRHQDKGWGNEISTGILFRVRLATRALFPEQGGFPFHRFEAFERVFRFMIRLRI
jgi:hypothetical protein